MKLLTDIVVGFFNLLTFKNILLVILLIIIFNYILPILKSGDNYTDQVFSLIIKGDFIESTRIKNSNFLNNNFNLTSDNAEDICINGDPKKGIPSCAERNRCFMLDETESRQCENNCRRNCYEI